MASATEWVPLGTTGEWLTEDAWDATLRCLRNRERGIRALKALRKVFPPSWSRAQTDVRNLHPVVHMQIPPANRYALLEVGEMLAIAPRKRTVERLKVAEEFLGVAAELRCGFLLHSAGAELTPEPIRDGVGPDWVARWPGGAVAVEVKAPRRSDQVCVRQELQVLFSTTLMQTLGKLRGRSAQGISVKFQANVPAIVTRTPLGAIDRAAVAAAAEQAAGAIHRQVLAGVGPGQCSAGTAGSFCVSLAPGVSAADSCMVDGFADDAEHEIGRVIERLREGIRQTRAYTNAPGLVLFDLFPDSARFDLKAAIEETLSNDSRAEHLAGVGIVTRMPDADETIGGMRVDNVIDIVPGAKADALESTLLPALRRCRRSHLHFDGLFAPAEPCAMLW